MARQEALLKVTKNLLKRRTELRKRLGMELLDMGGDRGSNGDVAEAAFGSSGVEMSSQLAQLESRELAQIELALARLKQNRYGTCDVCAKKIPVGRLNAVPHSVMCVPCQSQAEKDSDWLEVHAGMHLGELRDDADREYDYSAVQAQYGK